ncbi:hypothetical protein ACFL0D_00355 [Thermoproteota archaeon]
MADEIIKVVDEYLDKFISSDLAMIKIKDDKYSRNLLKKYFLTRIRERGITKVTSHTFMNELYLEKI